MARPKGSPKLGGRRKGTPNKATAERQAQIAASGITPLEFLLQVMRDLTAEKHVRIDAAKAAAPYVHPKLNSVELSGKNGGAIAHEVIDRPTSETREEWLARRRRELGGLQAMGSPARAANGSHHG